MLGYLQAVMDLFGEYLMKTQMKVLAVTALATVALGGCAGMSPEEKGAAVGAVAGGAVGAAATGGSTVGTVGGAVVGGAAGYEYKRRNP